MRVAEGLSLGTHVRVGKRKTRGTHRLSQVQRVSAGSTRSLNGILRGDARGHPGRRGRSLSSPPNHDGRGLLSRGGSQCSLSCQDVEVPCSVQHCVSMSIDINKVTHGLQEAQ